mgnify:CR=1 FL=1
MKKHAVAFGRFSISVRLAVLLVLGCIVLLVLIPTALQYADQARKHRAAIIEVEAAKDRVAQLEAELENWENPEFIASQARSRLGYVHKGETQYSVVDAEVEAPEEIEEIVGPSKPWTINLRDSLMDVDQPPAVKG